MDTKTILTIIHLFGAVLGAGGAFVSDFMFLKSVKDQNISDTEIGFLQLGGKVVWAGLFILVASGAGLYLLDMDRYLASSKFLAKTTIVGVIIANGIIVHTIHIPQIIKDKYVKKRLVLLVSGAISSVSWSSALVLGALRHVPYSYIHIMSVYAGFLCIAILITMFYKEKLIPSRRA